MTDHEKRTIRLGATLVVVYLVLFGGFRVVRHLEAKRSEYWRLVDDAQRIKLDLERYENRARQVNKLKETFHLDPAKLPKASLVAEASAAIQKAATTAGTQLGPIRESPGRPSARELASMQLEATGPVSALITLLHRLKTLGYPLVLDGVQITTDAAKPGMVKLTLTVIILDFDQWQNPEEAHHV